MSATLKHQQITLNRFMVVSRESPFAFFNVKSSWRTPPKNDHRLQILPSRLAMSVAHCLTLSFVSWRLVLNLFQHGGEIVLTTENLSKNEVDVILKRNLAFMQNSLDYSLFGKQNVYSLRLSWNQIALCGLKI